MPEFENGPKPHTEQQIHFLRENLGRNIYLYPGGKFTDLGMIYVQQTYSDQSITYGMLWSYRLLPLSPKTHRLRINPQVGMDAYRFRDDRWGEFVETIPLEDLFWVFVNRQVGASPVFFEKRVASTGYLLDSVEKEFPKYAKALRDVLRGRFVGSPDRKEFVRVASSNKGKIMHELWLADQIDSLAASDKVVLNYSRDQLVPRRIETPFSSS